MLAEYLIFWKFAIERRMDGIVDTLSPITIAIKRRRN